MIYRNSLLFLVFSFWFPFLASADEAIATTDLLSIGALNAGDSAWMMTATVLVLFMTLPGLALFYGGLVRAGSVLSVLMHCFTIACLASVLWVVGLYSLAFTEGTP